MRITVVLSVAVRRTQFTFLRVNSIDLAPLEDISWRFLCQWRWWDCV